MFWLSFPISSVTRTLANVWFMKVKCYHQKKSKLGYLFKIESLDVNHMLYISFWDPLHFHSTLFMWFYGDNISEIEFWLSKSVQSHWRLKDTLFLCLSDASEAISVKQAKTWVSSEIEPRYLIQTVYFKFVHQNGFPIRTRYNDKEWS